ncbi:uncharacterized protein LAESUDRAFT_737532 [Laetiporus sulphureus 93-53]|uniref:ATP phosphoribosyltransferase n=1 Tax=Laetiporus sulphureus 93-53 TaxID=1314785 RepID=A0A165DQL8_9APHY|nr:uncharacterized protein LAESUDRAFT_737532 [Laetiporus sulphureus 93-53]KZT05410.1 hypothetical protein LAESUDRAFT_737532 [Laetiporus sulphureus 93-53]
MPRFKLVFFSPIANTQPILHHLFEQFPRNVGKIGAYGGCAFVTRGTGQFIPLEGANPTIGSVGAPERVEEDRVEVVVQSDASGPGDSDVKRVLEELKKVHPYEEVAYDVYRLEEF